MYESDLMTETTSVLVFGHFNALHSGHIRLLQFARGFGEHLSVAVKSDRFVGSAA